MSKINITGGAYNINTDASKVDYDNTVSGLSATNMQDAIDELLILIHNIKLSDLSDTDITDPINGSSLIYSSEDQKWSARNIIAATIETGIATFGGVVASSPLVSLLLNLPVTQTGSGTPSPDNIRDIVGVQGMNVSRTGTNIWNEEWELGGYSSYTGQKSSATDRIRNVSPISVKPNMTIYNSAPVNISVFYYDINGEYLRYEVVNSHNTFTIASDVYYINFRFDTSYGTTYHNDTSLNYPSTDTSYHSYNGNIYTISFGQTVYSAILDVLNGKLYLIDELKTIDENSGAYMSSSATSVFLVEYFFNIEKDTDSVDCNIYQRAENRSSTTGVINNNPDYSFCCRNALSGIYNDRLMIKDTRFTSTEDYNTWLSTNPVKIAVKLAEPIEIDLTPTIINTLIGENVIFADVGDVTECKYTRK